MNLYYECTNRTPSVTHPDVALDVEGRGAGEPEGLHVGVDLGLEEAALGPGAPEPADKLVVDRTAVLVDQLDPLVAAVVGVAVVDDDVEAVCWSEARSVIY